MPNDVPDWTGLNQVNLVGGVSGAELGDLGAGALTADAFVSTILGGLPASSSGAIASFKAAAGQTIALRGVAGAALVGSAGAVNPAFGQATAAGNLLVAAVNASGAPAAPTTGAAGWVLGPSAQIAVGWVQIWFKPNCGAAEAAPGFTQAAGGPSLMAAQLFEFTGAATAAPLDQSATVNGVSPTLSLLNPAADVGFGDLVVVSERWGPAIQGIQSFTDTVNNRGVVTQGGTVDPTAGGAIRLFHAAFAIIPVAVVPIPVGIQEWPYDAQASSAPAVGTTASILLAASAGLTYTVARIAASLLSTTAAAHIPTVSLTDGTITPWYAVMGVQAAIGSAQAIDTAGLANKMGLGNAVTLAFNGNGAGGQQGLAIGAYLR